MKRSVVMALFNACVLLAAGCSDPEAARRAAEADAKFKQWALESTAVTDIAINNSLSLFVTLTPDKYTNEANVQQIADALARAYCLQTGRTFAVCRVYLGKRVYAQGDYRR